MPKERVESRCISSTVRSPEGYIERVDRLDPAGRRRSRRALCDGPNCASCVAGWWFRETDERPPPSMPTWQQMRRPIADETRADYLVEERNRLREAEAMKERAGRKIAYRDERSPSPWSGGALLRM